MTPRRAPAAAGFAAARQVKLVLLLALVTAALGVGSSLPLQPAFQDKLAGTLAGDHFIRNHPTFAPTDFFDFLKAEEGAIDGAARTMNTLGFLGVVLQMFFAGGIVVVLGRGPFSFGQFFEPARRNFWHNVKCFFLFAILTALLLGVWLGGVGYARHKLLEDVPPDAAVRSLTGWFLFLVALLLFAAASLLYDFARAARRYSPAIGAWRSFGFARRALAGSWGAALGLWVLWFVLGAAAVLVLFAIPWAMPAVSVPAIALLALLQFAGVWVRSAVRVAAWGSYLAFLDPRAATALPAIVRTRFAPAGAFAPAAAPERPL
ncbi:MAG TPA: hypothetical protein VFA98_01035 [Thermoanaerobaculia bacterium]|nr:hypothetical protein [Thermoanaerobaculia bacterium]